MRRLLAVLCCTFPAYAAPPLKPVAVCDDTVCTMSKADFELFQQFHAAVYMRAEAMEAVIHRQEGTIGELMNRLNRVPHCQMRMS